MRMSVDVRPVMRGAFFGVTLGQMKECPQSSQWISMGEPSAM